ncbi:hypothetical protein C9F11_17805 [Streptomyces sp. YIM 121038]|uniref:hypothetical protein n=1 Tax=Streptomyces sp. YIM 121038 TaxID=2136401 RepID=UPI0011103496|nr:hypothetical protein [Streptomyces sp. YIM 121038]QCX77213.1 hypothetical protein C9F11_17805 [Streptomyces sp. YIM 121038]
MSGHGTHRDPGHHRDLVTPALGIFGVLCSLASVYLFGTAAKVELRGQAPSPSPASVPDTVPDDDAF